MDEQTLFPKEFKEQLMELLDIARSFIREVKGDRSRTRAVQHRIEL
jgi:hypothetical protein